MSFWKKKVRKEEAKLALGGFEQQLSDLTLSDLQKEIQWVSKINERIAKHKRLFTQVEAYMEQKEEGAKHALYSKKDKERLLFYAEQIPDCIHDYIKQFADICKESEDWIKTLERKDSWKWVNMGDHSGIGCYAQTWLDRDNDTYYDSTQSIEAFYKLGDDKKMSKEQLMELVQKLEKLQTKFLEPFETSLKNVRNEKSNVRDRDIGDDGKFIV